jgi:hypothetical protein
VCMYSKVVVAHLAVVCGGVDADEPCAAEQHVGAVPALHLQTHWLCESMCVCIVRLLWRTSLSCAVASMRMSRVPLNSTWARCRPSISRPTPTEDALHYDKHKRRIKLSRWTGLEGPVRETRDPSCVETVEEREG